MGTLASNFRYAALCFVFRVYLRADGSLSLAVRNVCDSHQSETEMLLSIAFLVVRIKKNATQVKIGQEGNGLEQVCVVTFSE